ncbi:MAG TPA: lasso peptide biosynthesis B2 protein [Chloroflexaceae bacterium]|nr:lasso peptide biosynthesis B2 protein [Chloroflexaceae bacterium]
MNDTPYFAMNADDRGGAPLAALAGLRPHERRLLLLALPIVLSARAGLWLLTPRRLAPMLVRLAEATAAPQAHTDYAERAARAVARASRLVPGADSLTQAMATLTLMRRRGLTGRLRRGVRRDRRGALLTHAWVEHNGRVIIGGPRERIAQYTPLPGSRRDRI